MKALLLAPMGSVHRQHNRANIVSLQKMGYEVSLAANFTSNEPRERQNKGFVEWCKTERIEIIHIPFKRGGFFSNMLLLPSLKRMLKKGNLILYMPIPKQAV